MSDDTHSSSNHFKPASVACVQSVGGKLEVSYAHTKVSSKSRTTCKDYKKVPLLQEDFQWNTEWGKWSKKLQKYPCLLTNALSNHRQTPFFI